MRHLIIRHFGPLNEADIELSRLNLIIGLQGSGKSCVMMTACYCAWAQKRIALRQSAMEFENGTDFIDIMLSYYRIKGYLHEDTFIAYETDFMEFSYSHADRQFTHRWKNRWRFKRPKVSYVPAERNMVSLVSNWSRLETNYDIILDFKEDWDIARRFVKREQDMLGLGVAYEYDAAAGTDAVVTRNGKKIDLTSSSSGMQSLIPQFVHLDYVTKGIYDAEKCTKDKSYSEKQFVTSLLDILYKRNYEKASKESNAIEKRVVHFRGKDFVFENTEASKQFEKEVKNHLLTDHAEVFLEEPESNLFPPTQFQLMDWILELAKDKNHKNFFFIATHSPYILSHLLQENLKDFCLYLTYPTGNGMFNVKTASESDTQDIYDNGSDAFFNFDAFTN